MHAVTGIRRPLGALEFDAAVAGHRRGVWLHTGERTMLRGDAVLPATLLPAMTTGGTLDLPLAISPRMLRGAEEIQSIFAWWSRDWPFTPEPLRHVDVRTPAAPSAGVDPGTRVAAFFSGGVDSFVTVLDRPEVTDLVFVGGFDVPLADRPRLEAVAEHLRCAARELGRRFIRVETNLRLLSDPVLHWQRYYGAALATVATALSGVFARVHVGGWEAYANLRQGGTHPLVDHLWAPEGLEIFHDGARYDRAGRVERIAAHPVVQRRLRVCWQNAGGDLNCGRCQKCLCTMTALAIVGCLEHVKTFPPLDLGRVAAVRIGDDLVAGFWRSNLRLAERHGAPRALVAAIESALASHRPGGAPPPFARPALRKLASAVS